MRKNLKFICLIFLVFSCNKNNISYNYPDNQDYARKSRAGLVAGDLVIFGNKKSVSKANQSNSNKNENNVWLAAISVIGSLFPIDNIDSNLGVISTEWYQENAKSNNRIKIIATIKGIEAKKENLQIIIFKQQKLFNKNKQEKWQDLPNESSEDGSNKAKLIQEEILKRALIK